jgi:hypothetical protein
MTANIDEIQLKYTPMPQRELRDLSRAAKTRAATAMIKIMNTTGNPLFHYWIKRRAGQESVHGDR